jgi:hypothetical protein
LDKVLNMPPRPCGCTVKGLDRSIRQRALLLGVFILIFLSAGRSAGMPHDQTLEGGQFAVELLDLPTAFMPGQINRLRVKVSTAGAVQPLATGPAEGADFRIDLILVDATGRELYRRTVIKADESAARFHFLVPADAVGPITVRADLNYRRFSQRLVDWILGSNERKAKVISTASAVARVPLSQLQPKAVEQMQRLLLMLALGRAH